MARFYVKTTRIGFAVVDHTGREVALRHASHKAQQVADALNAGKPLIGLRLYGLEHGPALAHYTGSNA